jgi:hypothetical protein
VCTRTSSISIFFKARLNAAAFTNWGRAPTIVRIFGIFILLNLKKIKNTIFEREKQK